VAGANWNVKVESVRVLGKCGGDTTDIIAGMRWAAGLPVPGVPNNTNKARVINMSFGNDSPCFDDPDYQNAINEVVAEGVTVVAAAGNSHMDVAGFTPAGCDNVISVAASDFRGYLVTRYSNFGATVKIMAPGGDVHRDDNGDGNGDGVMSMTHPDMDAYAYYNGTSQAAPHVSGVIALLLSCEQGLTPQQILERLQYSALPRDKQQCPVACGAGLLNAAGAIGTCGTRPGRGDLALGGYRGGNNGYVFVRQPNGHIKYVLQPNSGFRAVTQGLDGITNAKVVGNGTIVLRDNSLLIWNSLTEGGPLQQQIFPKTDDVVMISQRGTLLRDGSAYSMAGAGIYFSGMKDLSTNGEYALFKEGYISCEYNEMDRGPKARSIWGPLRNVQMVQANRYQGAAVLADGTLTVWDREDFSERDPSKRFTIPHPPASFKDVYSIAAGDDYFLGLTYNGTIVSWGRPTTGPPPGLTDIVAIGASLYGGIAAAIKRDGTIVTWDPHSGN